MTIARFIVALIIKKLDWREILAELGTIPRFGLACALYAAIFKIVRRILRFLRAKDILKVNRDVEYIVATGLSGLGLLVSPPGDIVIFKFVLY